MQNGAQQTISTRLAVPPQSAFDVVDPDVGLLDSLIDAFETNGAHSLFLL